MAKMLNWECISAFRKEVGGVRIEDNVAVGVNGGRKGLEGVLNLTMAAGVPKAPRAIESIMQ
ncbi:hypothetical protein DUNSADRAFT_13028 [Dunaliella salina]|uniref:Uncharacterized protein n=1 Tax=Dunaliella salina TaxID=3046 RepID=A0ABQ7GA68_DUNSA|nr:hypothetical protein DUNSADRAFT_13028 [Dunaliella salina]|eukprot:KAF5831497.1 hypothetical protein DUNSADRAFT_13028 [Dunaliella salina]